MTYTAAELESGNAEGLTGSIGDGSGKWRLTVESEQHIVAMSLLSSPTGHLTNLSTAPDNGTDGTHSVPLFPSASDANGRQGFLRVVNHGDEAGEVTIRAFDDTDREYETLTLAIGASETKHFNSDDLELGNAGKGLTGSTGAGAGNWRLELSSDLDIEVLAYVRTTDGFWTAIHDPVPRSAKRHRVAVFNPGSNANQVSVLRLVNADEEPAEVTVIGVDDRGMSPNEGVTITVPADRSVSYTAAELESGNAEGLDGSLGDGNGKWRLTVNADRPIVAMSLLSSPTGHLTNLSTAPQRGAGPVETADEAFEALISPIVQSKCVNCHYEGNTTGNMPVFARDTDVDHQATNLREFEDYLADIEDGANRILNKIQGALDHGGGSQVSAGTPEFAGFEQFLELLGAEIEEFVAVDLFEGVTLESPRRTLWRAAIVFAGRIPTEEEYAEVDGGTDDNLRVAIRRLMEGPGFHEFLVRGANDRLLTDRDIGRRVIDPIFGYFVAFNDLNHEKLVEAETEGDHTYDKWANEVQYGLGRAPLELIAHMAENDLSYTEILTADYIMANPMAAEAYGAATEFEDATDPREFKASRIVSYYGNDQYKKLDYDPPTGTRVIEAGELLLEYPHAGVLNTTVFLLRYPTTATNRNRARSRWTYYHFLGDDIEKSEARTMDPDVLKDTNNPTMHNPACTACHERMDPVAGAFQYYDDIGYLRSGWEAKDSLDEGYKQATRGRLVEIEAASWEARQTFSMREYLEPGELMFLRHVNNLDDEDEDDESDRDARLASLVVRDVDNDEIVDRVEWQDLDEHCEHDGAYNDVGGAESHYQWWGECHEIPLSIPQEGTYAVEMVAWADQSGDEPAMVEFGVGPLYRDGDTWYRDMRDPGFLSAPGLDAEAVPGDYADNSLQWLAQRIAEDERFATATVKFWWPALMGSEIAEQPAIEDDADYAALRLAARAQSSEVERLADAFRQGFPGSPHAHNLKDLLVEFAMSDWFRAAATSDADPVRRVALRHAGAKRLLTPEELVRKTEAITGFVWGRNRPSYPSWGGRSPAKRRNWTDTRAFGLLYGGIDSGGIAERARGITPIMGGVAKHHGAAAACPVVMKELFVLAESDRRLLAGVDRNVSPAYEFGSVLDVHADTNEEPDVVSVTGALTAGEATVVLTMTNELWDDELGTHVRRLYLDRIVLRDAAGEEVDSRQLEEVDHDCAWQAGDAIVFWDACQLPVKLVVPSTGSYEVEVTAWAEHDQDQDGTAKLEVVVEGDPESAAGSGVVKEKLAELHRRMLGTLVDPNSPEVAALYDLFVEVWKGGRDTMKDSTFDSQCDWQQDQYYLEGILDGAWLDPEDGAEWDWERHGWDHEQIARFFDGIDWSDRHYVARTWVAVLAYVLTDYRYLYL